MLLSDLFHRFETKKKNRQKFLAPGFFSPFSNRTHTKENNTDKTVKVSVCCINRNDGSDDDEKNLFLFLMAKLVSQEETREKKSMSTGIYQIKDYAVYSFTVEFFHGRRCRRCLFGTRRP
jgi:hypothetical protein